MKLITMILIWFLSACVEQKPDDGPTPHQELESSKNDEEFTNWIKGVHLIDTFDGQRITVQASKPGVYTEYEICRNGECKFGISTQNIIDIPNQELDLKLAHQSSSLQELVRLRACVLQNLKKDCSPWKEKQLKDSLVRAAEIGNEESQRALVPEILKQLIARHRQLRDKIRILGQEVVVGVRAYDEDFKKSCPRDAVRYISQLQVDHFAAIGIQGLGEGLVDFSEAKVLAELNWEQTQQNWDNMRYSIENSKKTRILFGAMSISGAFSSAASATSPIPGVLPIVSTFGGGALILMELKNAKRLINQNKFVTCEANTKIRVLLDSIYDRLKDTNGMMNSIVTLMKTEIEKMTIKELEALAKLYPETTSFAASPL